MKAVLAGLTLLAAATAVVGPAAAFDRSPDAIDIRDGGDWRGDRGDWQGDRWEDRDDALSEGQIARRLMRQGFVRIDDIERRRDRYVVRAVRPNGALIRLAVDAYDGEIVARERIGWVADDRGYEPRRPAPATGVEFDLGSGRIGIYSR